MQKINILLVFLLVIFRSGNGLIENLFGVPIEFNLHDNYDDWEAGINNDIWNEDDQSVAEENVSFYTLESLCADYDLFYNDQLIDCGNIKTLPKKLELKNNHYLSKREASEDSLEEGSGDDDIPMEAEKAKADESEKTAKVKVEEPPKVEPTEAVKVEEPPKVEPLEKLEPSEPKAVESEKTETTEEVKVEEPSNGGSLEKLALLPKPTTEESEKVEPKAEESEKVEPKVEESEKVEPKAEESEKVETKAEESEKVEPNVEESEKVEPKAEESEKAEPKAEESEKSEPKAEESEKAEPKAEESEKVVPNAEETEKAEPKAEESEKVEPKAEESERTEPVENKEPTQEETKLESDNVKPLELVPVVDIQENNEPAALPSEDNLQSIGEEATSDVVNEQEKHDQITQSSEEKLKTAEDSKQEKNSISSRFKTQSLDVPEDLPLAPVIVPATDKAVLEVIQEETTKATQETPKIEEVESKKKVDQDVPANEKPKEQETKESSVDTAIKDDKTELSETPEQVEEPENKNEEINPLQSGMAILKTNANLGETDKLLAKSKSKESIKSTATEAEEPKSGASESNETSKKNNILLFIIFGAVLVVGAAAFGYNYYRKQHNKAIANRIAENGASKTDPEEGREMKPLMKLPENNTVEYKDEK